MWLGWWLVVGWVWRAKCVIRWRNKTQHHIRKRKLQWTATLIMGGYRLGPPVSSLSINQIVRLGLTVQFLLRLQIVK